MTGVISSIKLLESNVDYQLLRVDVGIDSYLLFGDYNHYMTYLNKEVTFATRNELVNGNMQEVIVTIAERNVIQTVDKDRQITKLIPNDTNRAVSNFSIGSLRYGDIDAGCIALMYDYEECSSPKAKWVDLKMIDMESKYFVLKLFTKFANHDYREALEQMKGRYIRFDISSTKYGYQTNEIDLVEQEVVTPPEVEVAYSYILDVLDTDDDLKQYCSSTGLIEYLKTVYYYERGYHLVEIASELMLADTVDSITNTYDSQNLKRMCIATRGYLLPKVSKYSKPVANSIVLSGTSFRLNDELMAAVDSPNEGSSELKRMYAMIRCMSRFIIIDRKGDKDETEKVLKEFASSFMFSTTGSLLF